MQFTLSQVFCQLYPLNYSWENWKGVSILLMNEQEVFLIKRSVDMPSHKGQIAGLGGMRKEEENTVEEVVMREFLEETSLNLDSIRLIGTLEPLMMAKNLSIVPVVAEVLWSREKIFQMIKSNGEWSDFFTVSWEILSKYDLWGKGLYVSKENKDIYYFPIMRNSYNHFQNQADSTHLLWGATAGIIRNVLNLGMKK